MPQQSLKKWDVTKFLTTVKLMYQELAEVVPATTTLITVQEGREFEYPTMGALTARNGTTQTQVDPQTTTINRIPGRLNISDISVMLGKMEQSFNNIAEVNLLLTNIRGAMNRKLNDVVIKAVTESANVDILDIPAAGTNLNLAKFQQLSQTFNARSIPKTDRVFLIGAATDTLLMENPSFIDNQIYNKGAIESGTFDGATIQGFKLMVIPDAVPGDPNGVLRNPAPGVVTCLAYHKSAVGFARGLSTEISIDRIPMQKNATLMFAEFATDSIVIDGRGIIRVGADTNVAP